MNARQATMMRLLRAGSLATLLAGAGCGDRAPYWSQPLDTPAHAFGLPSAVALLDASADRVVLLTPDADQRLTTRSIPVGHDVINTALGPDGKRLFVVSAGHRPTQYDARPNEPPSLTVIDPDASPPSHRYVLDTLTDPLAGIAIDSAVDEQRWVVLYATTGPNQAFVQNPNELLFVDLKPDPTTGGDAPAVSYTLHSFGGRPVRFTFTPTLSLPSGSKRLLIVESDQDLSILEPDDPQHTEISVPLTSGGDTRRLSPAGVVVDDGDPTRNDDSRIGVRLANDSTVLTLQLTPDTTTTVGFRPTPNLTDVGGVPSDIAFVRTDGGLRLAALVPSANKATLIDPVSSLTTDVTLPAPYQSISLVKSDAAGATPSPAAAPDVALLWNSVTAAGNGVAVWELGQTAGQPYRSIDPVAVTGTIPSVLEVPTRPALRVLGTNTSGTFYVLDLDHRTAAPLVSSLPTVALYVSPDGDQVWSFVPNGSEVAAVNLDDDHPRSLTLDGPVSQVFEVRRPNGHSAIVLDGTVGVGAIVYDAATLADQTRRVYSGLLLGGAGK